MEQNSQEIAKMSENAKVHLDLCFTYPNGSPHDQESTKIGREGSKIHENMLRKHMRQKRQMWNMVCVYPSTPDRRHRPQGL